MMKVINFLKSTPFFDVFYTYQSSRRKKIIRRKINKVNPVILEIGAYDGEDTLEFLKIFPKARIYAFEPHFRSIENFKKNVKSSRVELIEMAVSDKEGQADFHLSSGKSSKGEPVYWPGSSSLKEPKECTVVFPWIEFKKKIRVKTINLDSWAENKGIDRIDLIWADVQGSEKELIAGAKRTLRKTFLFFTEFYNNEMYKGQIDLNGIEKMLPNFVIDKKFRHDALFRNKNMHH